MIFEPTAKLAVKWFSKNNASKNQNSKYVEHEKENGLFYYETGDGYYNIAND